MLLGPSGQNIYPEEIEDKLNNMPYVAESIIVQQNEKLVGLVYPDFDDAFAHGLNNDDIERVMEENRVALNAELPAYSQIFKMKIYPEEFEKTVLVCCQGWNFQYRSFQVSDDMERSC